MSTTATEQGQIWTDTIRPICSGCLYNERTAQRYCRYEKRWLTLDECEMLREAAAAYERMFGGKK